MQIVSCVCAEARDAHACAATAADARDAQWQARLGRMRTERQEAAGRQAALEVSISPQRHNSERLRTQPGINIATPVAQEYPYAC